MFKLFYPDIIFQKFLEVSPAFLNQNKISALLIDIDNTLVDYGTEEPTQEVRQWFDLLKKNGIRACIFSNASEKRVKRFCETLDVPSIFRANKPNEKKFRIAMKMLDVQPMQTAMMGDQLLTDIYGGNKIGLKTIFIHPISTKEMFFIRCKRLIEKAIFASNQPKA